MKKQFHIQPHISYPSQLVTLNFTSGMQAAGRCKQKVCVFLSTIYEHSVSIFTKKCGETKCAEYFSQKIRSLEAFFPSTISNK